MIPIRIGKYHTSLLLKIKRYDFAYLLIHDQLLFILHYP